MPTLGTPGGRGTVFAVVSYDITDNRRRNRTMKLLEGYGEHVQESVFECDLEPRVFRRMLQQLGHTVDHERDNVRIYYLCRTDVQRIETLGVGRAVQVAREFRII
jgi:CRISPR-associated protein Cas2